MHPHFQQKSIRIILYIFGGILALGTLLDSLANAIL
jgi:hypothetical protein